MNIYEKVREFLLANPGQLFTPRQIHDGICIEGPMRDVSWACTTMFSRGVLIDERIDGKRHYQVNPEWRPRQKSTVNKTQRRKEYRETWLKNRAAKGLPHYKSPAEIASAKRREAREAAFAEIKAKREAEKAAMKERRSLERKSKLVTVVAKNAEKRTIKSAPKQTKIAPAMPGQSVEDFLAQGGKIERLPRGATSGRLAA